MLNLSPTLTILVPTRNEQDSIISCLTRLLAVAPDAQIIVIDGGTDQTGAHVRELAAHHTNLEYLPNPDDRGKGHAIQVGVRAARGQIILEIDADLQFLPEEIPKLIQPLLDDQADMVLGSRFCAASGRNSGSTPWHRSLGNHCFSALASILMGQRCTDVLTGFKAWKREVTESFSLRCESYSYEIELPVKARRQGWRVVDVPITTEPRRTGTSSVRVVSVALRLLRDSFQIRFGSL